MKYSYEFKKECVQLYREGRWADTPEGVKEKRFHDTIKEWFKLEEKHGPEILKHGNNIEWTTDEKLEVVSKVLAGNTIGSVAIETGINRGQLYSWVNKYKIYGYNGLVNKKKGRKPKNTTMKKTNIHEAKKLNESEREELIRLRAENEYIKAENEIIKKEIALREKNYAAQLKAKKQRLSKKLKEKGYRLKYLLIAIDLPKSTYYFEINKVDAVKIRNKNIENKIFDIFNNHKGRYGVRRVYRELLNQGYTINHKKVQRIMHELKLFGKRPREKYHSYKGKVGKIADNIIDRNFKANKPLQKWSTDVSQFNFSWGKCYISPILDMYTNEIISYDLSLSPNLEQISNMLMKAFNKFPILNNLILHSDQGWQYQHKYYIRELKKHGIIQSMSRKGNCYDNSIMETFFGRLKNEVYYGYEKSYNSFEEFSKAIEKYIYYYNNERIQKKTKWMPPTKYRLASTTTN